MLSKSNKKISTVAFVLTSAGFTIALQMTPLLLLETIDFGYYSIVQLLAVLGSSLSISLINEADVRRMNRGCERSQWRDFSAVTCWLSLAFLVVTFLVSCFVTALSNYALLWAIGVSFSIYRGTTRYRLTQEGILKRLIIGDLTGVVVIVCAVLAALTWNDGQLGLSGILVVWLSSQILSTLFTKFPSSVNPRRAVAWVRNRLPEISALVPDSALQDVGAFWGPNLIALVLDVFSMGLYRGVTTVAAPIRLILTPLRPLFAHKSGKEIYSSRSLIGISTVGISLSLCAFLVFWIIDSQDLPLGVLGDLTTFALPIGVYIFGSFLSYFYSIYGRISLRPKILLATRLFQAILLGLFPVLFALVFGVAGAIWALAFGSLLTGLLWYTTLRKSIEPR